MNALSIVGVALRQVDILYYLQKKKQHDYENSVDGSGDRNENVWDYSSVDDIREKLFEVECHMYAHSQTNGKTLEEFLSHDDLYLVKHSLMAVKVYLYSLINMSSQFFQTDDTTSTMVKEQVGKIIEVVDTVKTTLTRCGVVSDIVNNGATSFYRNVLKLSALLSAEDLNITQNVEVFGGVLNLAKSLRHGELENFTQFSDENDAECDVSSPGRTDDEQFFELIPVVAKELIDELAKHDGTQEDRLKVLDHLKLFWSGWEVDKDDISYNHDEFGEKIWLGQGPSTVVYSGFLKANDTDALPIAVKTKAKREHNIHDLLRECFVHLIAQHPRIITLYGMQILPVREQHARIALERMPRTLAHALEADDEERMDRTAILRDLAAALAHMHDQGIVHRNVTPSNVLLNEDKTQAKLADFGVARFFRRSFTTVVARPTESPFYLAPEVRQNATCVLTPKMDCWSFGIVACEVMNADGRDAFVGAHLNDVYGAAVEWASSIDDQLLRLATLACVQLEPKDRPEMKDVYLHLARVVSLE